MNEEDLIYTYEELEDLAIKYQDLYIDERNKVKKAIAILEKYEVHYRPGELYLKDILLDILKDDKK